MPATVQVKVVAARDLPIMDRSSELTDAFVELKLGQAYEKTEVCAKTLNPVWDSKWFSFKMDEEDLQEEPLQIRMMDHDTYSAHNAIGKVYIALNSLAGGSTRNSGDLDGWFPIYDTLHGIRGEVHLKVKVEILEDQHRFRQSSCGIMFFTCPQTPSCFFTKAIHGFVEELVVNDDPEYKWIDRIRTPRASNEARQRLFSKLTGELQRKIGLKTIEVSGNAVIGYQQYFDLEGDTGIVVRGIGTCVTLVPKLQSTGVYPVQLPISVLSKLSNHRLFQEDIAEAAAGGGGMLSPKPKTTFRKTPSSESEGPGSPSRTTTGQVTSGSSSAIGTSHHGLTMDGVAASTAHLTSNPIPNPVPIPVVSSSFDFPFYTLTSLPPGLLQHVGGIVSSRSVKLLDKIKDPDEPETRDAWWQEVRNEVRCHIQALKCNAVIGYSESTTICDTLCIFSAIGTAVCISTHHYPPKKQISPGSSTEETRDGEAKESHPHCGVCHIPYSPLKPPFKGRLARCSICNLVYVPAIILSTAEPPNGIATRGRGTLVQVRVVYPKRRLKGDENAIFISKQLPFLEHRLYTRLLNKLRVKGMNAVFCLQVQCTVGDTMIMGVATGTGVFLEALPAPQRVIISADKDSAHKPERIESIQNALNRSQEENRTKFDLHKPLDIPRGDVGDRNSIEDDSSATCEFILSSGQYETVAVNVEDHLLKEEDIMELILEKPLPNGFSAVSTTIVPGIPASSLSPDCRMITIVTKKSLESGRQQMDLEKQCAQFFDSVQQALAFKMRRMIPCVLTRIHYDLDLPEDDVLQIAVTAMVTRICSSECTMRKSQSDEMIFTMEDAMGPSCHGSGQEHATNPDESPCEENKAAVVRISPLPFLCGYHVERYLKIINFFVIRENTSIRESGGVDSFMHLFTLEALAIARAHVAAMGGNALLNFRLNDCVLIEHPHKNQAQCLLNVSGDAAVLSPVLSSLTLPGMDPREAATAASMETPDLDGDQISKTTLKDTNSAGGSSSTSRKLSNASENKLTLTAGSDSKKKESKV